MNNFEKLKHFAELEDVEDAARYLDDFPCALCCFYVDSISECMAPSVNNVEYCIEGRKKWLLELDY